MEEKPTTRVSLSFHDKRLDVVEPGPGFQELSNTAKKHTLEGLKEVLGVGDIVSERCMQNSLPS